MCRTEIMVTAPTFFNFQQKEPCHNYVVLPEIVTLLIDYSMIAQKGDIKFLLRMSWS